MNDSARGISVGIDIGGTFTDIAIYTEHGHILSTGKVLTTPNNPASGALRGLQQLTDELDLARERITSLVHGTTLIANAIVERKGAKTAMLTTQGFRDILETRREKRYNLYDLFSQFPAPLVPRSLRRGVPERITTDGSILEPLDLDAARSIVDALIARGIESIAVCFLHSYKNPIHEQALRQLISERSSTVSISLSSGVVPEIREYERFSTTVCNAYTQPVMARYLGDLQHGLQQVGVTTPLHIMLSNGGITTPSVAESFPVRVIESGPAGGVVAAAYFGRQAGSRHLLSFDMGGTTAKLSFIEDEQPTLLTELEVDRAYRFQKGSGLTVKVPVVDMIEIGAGGGSIAHVGALGLLNVGPESAGAQPGPACYGFGGRQPTVTDADLILGYINSEHFLGDDMTLNVELAERAIRDTLCASLQMDTVEVAWSIHRVVNENMVNAARIYMAEKGRDPKRYHLVAFGGAGPIHAYWLAKRLGIGKVLVPPKAGVTSAVGFLVTPLSFDYVRTYLTRISDIDLNQLNELYAEMEKDALRMMHEAGVADPAISMSRYAEMRYVGQGREIFVPLPAGPYEQGDSERLHAAFEQRYRDIYSRSNPAQAVEAINWRLFVRGPKPVLDLRGLFEQASEDDPKPRENREVYFGEAGGYCECPTYDRSALPPGMRIAGPALLEEFDTTTVVGPDAYAEIDDHFNIVITLSKFSR